MTSWHCKRQGCHNLIVPSLMGGRRRVYCRPACKVADWLQHDRQTKAMTRRWLKENAHAGRPRWPRREMALKAWRMYEDRERAQALAQEQHNRSTALLARSR